MTAPARISQADMDRAMKSARNAGWPSVRVVMDLEKRVIEILASKDETPPSVGDGWDDDDDT